MNVDKLYKQGFMIFAADGDMFPEVLSELPYYTNIDGFLVGIYDGKHYASPTKEKPMICLDYPVPLEKQKILIENNE